MNFQEKPNKELFAIIKPEGNHVLGRIIRINREGLTLRSASDDEIDPKSLLDIFTKGKFFFKDLPVDIVSDKRTTDRNSFSKLLIREITIRFIHLDCSQKYGMDSLLDNGMDAGE
jgi:hypothetical protein